MNFRFLFIIGIFAIFLTGEAPVYAGEGSMPAQRDLNLPVEQESEQLDFAQGLLSRGMYDMAILQYQKFISAYPHSPSLQEAYLSLGEGYFLSQDFEKAIDTFNQFIQLYPQSEQLPVSILRLGQIDIQLRKYDEAIKEFTSIDFQKKLTGSLLQSFDFYTAQAYFDKSDTADALDYYQKAVTVEGASDYTALAFKEIGEIYTQNRQYKEALDAYSKSLPLAKDYSLTGELTYKIAEVQFLSGQYTDAIKGFGQALDHYPGLGFTQEALANMLLAYFNLGQYEQLLDIYKQKEKQIKDDDTYFAIQLSAVLAYIELKEYDQANALLDKMLVVPALKSQERARIFIKKADILIRQKKFKDALALLDAYSSENVDDADENLFLKAQADFGLGEYDHAFNLYENVYLNFPDSRFNKAALLGQAHTRRETGRFKESEALFLKYYDVQDQPDLKSEALYDAVMMAAKAEDISGVITAGQEYLKAFPAGEQKAKVLLMLADNDGKNDHPQDAVKLLQGFLADPQSSQSSNAANFLLGYNQQLLGNSDQALAAYAQVDQHKENGEYYVAALKNMAIIYLSQKKYDQASIYFDRLISQAGQNDLQLKTYIWVCNEYLKDLKYDDVLRIAAVARKYFPAQDLMEIEYFEAEALRGLGRCNEAGKDYDLVTASTDINAYTGSAHIGHGLCLAKDQKFDEARQEFQKSLDQNADDYTVTVHARFEMANVDASQGNMDDALKLYLLVATIYDDQYYCSESLLKAGNILEKERRPAEAVKLYSEILDKYKNSTAAPDAQERLRLLK